MKTLIVYYSFTGNNQKLAIKLQQKLNCDLYGIQEVRKRKPITILIDLLFKRLPKVMEPSNDLSQYDHVIFIAPIWSGKIASPLRSFLINERSNICRYSFITVCSGRPQQQSWITNGLRNVLEKEPVIVQELCINDLLPEEKKNNIKYTTPYRILGNDLDAFKDKIEAFITGIQVEK
jgi:flavodoxin